MEEFGKSHKENLAKFLKLPNGIPNSDTFRCVFKKKNPSELSSCLINWVSVEREKRSVVAINVKTICGSENSSHKAYHVISAFVAEKQITLSKLTVEEKMNEIVAVPELLDLIDIQGEIVTADAMNCKKDSRKNHIKGSGLHNRFETKSAYALSRCQGLFNIYGSTLPTKITHKKNHSMIEKREYRLLTDIS